MTRLYSSTLLEIRVRPAQLTAILKVLNLGGDVPGFQNRIEESTQLIGGFNPSIKHIKTHGYHHLQNRQLFLEYHPNYARSHHILMARHEFQCQLPMSQLSAAHQHVKTSGVLPLAMGPRDRLDSWTAGWFKRKWSENLHSVLFLDDFPTYFPRKKGESLLPAPSQLQRYLRRLAQLHGVLPLAAAFAGAQGCIETLGTDQLGCFRNCGGFIIHIHPPKAFRLDFADVAPKLCDMTYQCAYCSQEKRVLS